MSFLSDFDLIVTFYGNHDGFYELVCVAVVEAFFVVFRDKAVIFQIYSHVEASGDAAAEMLRDFICGREDRADYGVFKRALAGTQIRKWAEKLMGTRRGGFRNLLGKGRVNG